ncbi:MAG: hypothetical protein JSV12_01945 [Candidatus Bathyarchaeota archaeon]|nr:MAG: hypothetical protein JSV12_01945 [Candidatus Bathyarchaeota archaeon]
MSDLNDNLRSIVRTLKGYVDKGALDGSAVGMEEPEHFSYFPKFRKPLNFFKSFKGKFVAVDCSTKPLMRGNRFGVYLLRVAYASVDPSEKENPVMWGTSPLQERSYAAIGDEISRKHQLERLRFEYESELAETLLLQLDLSDYLLLDGASYFGRPEDRRFALALYEKARKRNLNFLTISKNSPSLVDEKGRDLISQIAVGMPTATACVYHPIKELKADPHKNRFGDGSLVKLNSESFRVFRCDIMDYLAEGNIVQLLSPLTSISGDPRCLGYPVALYLAHDFAKVSSDAKLLYCRDLLEKALANEGLLDSLKMEEALSNFRSELYGLRYPWELEEYKLV